MKEYSSCLAFPVFRSFKISILFFDVGFLSPDIHDSQDRRARRKPFLIPLYHFLATKRDQLEQITNLHTLFYNLN